MILEPVFIYFLVFILSILFSLKILLDTSEVCFLGPHGRSDNEKMILAAKKINFFSWLSNIHSIKLENNVVPRAELREYWVLCISLLLKLYKNKSTDHPSVLLSLIANFFSLILIFTILKNYFNLECGILGFLFYLTMFWPYAKALHKGHLLLSQMFFLLSVLCLQYTNLNHLYLELFLYFLSGVFIFMSFSSSSASRKFPIILFFALIYSFEEYFVFSIKNFYFFCFLFIFVFLLLKLHKFLFFKFQIIIIKFFNKNLPFLNWKIDYIFFLNKFFFSIILIGVLFASFSISLSEIYLNLLFFIIGLTLVFFHIFFPIKNFKDNLIRYYVWLNASTWTSHFAVYPNSEKVFKTKITEGFRGGGIIWYHKLFLRMMPVTYLSYIFINIISICILLLNFPNSKSDLNILFLIIFIISLMPVLIHELTKGMKVGRTLFSVVPTMIFSIVYNYYFIMSFFSYYIIFYALLIVTTIQFLHSLYVLYNDVIPCRMAPNILKKSLLQINCKTFYTYDVPYNYNFVNVMQEQYPDLFNIKYINTLKEVKSGIVVIPHTSSKAYGMESQEYSAQNGDFREDINLNLLLDNKQIEHKSLFKIKTFGTSKIYPQYSEVTTYRDLIIRDISKYDRWLGNAWILKI